MRPVRLWLYTFRRFRAVLRALSASFQIPYYNLNGSMTVSRIGAGRAPQNRNGSRAGKPASGCRNLAKSANYQRFPRPPPPPPPPAPRRNPPPPPPPPNPRSGLG